MVGANDSGGDTSRSSVSAGSGPTVADLGEQALIGRLTAMSTRAAADLPTDSDRLLIGPGDDAAVIAMSSDLIVSTDSLVQDRHFRLEWSTPENIGRRAAIQSAADIAAMGGRVSALVVSIACPPSTGVDWVLAVNHGLNRAAVAVGARVVGGDVVSADQIVLTVTVFGSTDGRAAVPVSGARVGDRLAVSGPLGSSAAGLALLMAGRADSYPDLVAAHRVPVVDLAVGVIAAEHGAHAMTDVSDGLGAELETMARASGVSLEVVAASIPMAAGLAEAGAELGVDPAGWAIGGGEDHQLLAAFGGAPPAGWTVIGSVLARDDDRPVRIDGSAPAVPGWQSF
ncbi:thiamine-phosphate kinase [Williamsia maris]|uniref:Thiamine-monophosphate kinase n=1 Tax=Williamsia maris TaxID=72806 RepID=A0ABT1HFZ9_9NOCA|nr:thiamine-monophosphate kinase [Williamsia maris]